MTRKLRNLWSFVTISAALVALAGCGEINTQQPIGDWSEQSIAPVTKEVPTGKSMVGTAADIPSDGFAGIAANKNKVTDADIYWKLRALIGGLQQDSVPDDIAEGIDATKKQIENTEDDQFKPGLEEVFGEIEAAWEAYKLDKSLRAEGIDASTLPFGIGRESIESRLAEKYPSTRTSEILATVRDRHADSKRAILAYASAHHAAPQAVRSESLNRASEKLERVADDMDKWRIEHHDHPIGRSKNPAPGTQPENIEHNFRMPEMPGLRSPLPSVN
jgi:hypothetical protein